MQLHIFQYFSCVGSSSTPSSKYLTKFNQIQATERIFQQLSEKDTLKLNTRLNDKQAFVMVRPPFASVSLLSNLPLKGFHNEASGVQLCSTVAMCRRAHTAPSHRRRGGTLYVSKS